MSGGDEFDAFTGWRYLLNWEPGERKELKRQYNRRQRRMLKDELKEELQELELD
jgi:hypothetical protein